MIMPAATPGYVNTDYLSSIVKLTQPIKQRSYQLMQVSTGQRVLDVGCGPATDTLPLAKLVTSSGEVIGVDYDGEMIETANQRAREAKVDSWVNHQQAQVPPLFFKTGTFDACRSERLFQHMQDCEQLLSEMIRVTKPGGKVVVADTDHSSLSFDISDSSLIGLEWRLRQYRTEMYADGYAGRKLVRLFNSFGLTDAAYEIFPLAVTEYEAGRYFAVMDKVEQNALADGVVTEQELQQMHAVYREADNKGQFFCYAVMVLVVGTKP